MESIPNARKKSNPGYISGFLPEKGKIEAVGPLSPVGVYVEAGAPGSGGKAGGQGGCQGQGLKAGVFLEEPGQ